MARAGTDIACAHRVVQSSLNLEPSGGVWPESGVSMQIRSVSSAPWGMCVELEPST
jgi:hypothetical protein